MSDEVKHAQVLELMRTKGLPAYKAYMKVYPNTTDENAKKNAYRIFRTENEGMKQALIDVGLDTHTIAGKIKDMIDSKTDKRAGVELAVKINGSLAPMKQEIKAEVTGLKSVLDELEK